MLSVRLPTNPSMKWVVYTMLDWAFQARVPFSIALAVDAYLSYATAGPASSIQDIPWASLWQLYQA